VCGGGKDVGIIEATEYSKIMVGGWFVAEELEMGAVGCFCGGEPVDEESGSE
jgi:hypothetical protein